MSDPDALSAKFDVGLGATLFKVNFDLHASGGVSLIPQYTRFPFDLPGFPLGYELLFKPAGLALAALACSAATAWGAAVQVEKLHPQGRRSAQIGPAPAAPAPKAPAKFYVGFSKQDITPKQLPFDYLGGDGYQRVGTTVTSPLYVRTLAIAAAGPGGRRTGPPVVISAIDSQGYFSGYQSGAAGLGVADRQRHAGDADGSRYVYNPLPTSVAPNDYSDPNTWPVYGNLTVLQALRWGTQQPIATLFDFGVHPDLLEGSPLISPDWPAATISHIDATYGGDAMFLPGTLGEEPVFPGGDVQPQGITPEPRARSRRTKGSGGPLRGWGRPLPLDDS